MSRARAAAGGDRARTACARVLLRGGADEETGQALSAAQVAKRAGWCAALVRDMAARLAAGRWNPGDLGVLASGLDGEGRPLPARAWMAMRRLGWAAVPPDGIRVNDRIIRMAQEQAGRALRSACWRDALIRGIAGTWPADPARRTAEEWDAVRAAVPGGAGISSGAVRARTRQARRFLDSSGRLPGGVHELERPPRAAAMLVLAAADRQQASIERHESDPRRAMLRVQLPSRPDPRSYGDWSWVSIPLVLPPTVPARAALHLPTLHVAGTRARAEIAFTQQVPQARRSGHVTAVGLDWGLNTLCSAGAVRVGADGTITALGAGAQFRADGVLGKQHWLRRHGERLRARLDQYERLMAGREDHHLTGKAAVLAAEERHVADRRSRLNQALAWSAARWTADQALAAGATAVYVEDLRDLEAKGMGRTLNTRLSQTVRGQIISRLRHICAEHGIAVVTVPPRGTSRCCPRCLAALRHCKAPDRPAAPGWKWARCPACGWQGDRDTGAWQRIAARGISHQENTAAGRASGTMTIRAIDDILEAKAVVAPYASGKDRSKTRATPRRSTSRRAPGRRAAPSPPRAPRSGQRPEGRVTTARPLLPRAARRDQDASTASKPARTRPPCRARGAALGAGFHLNAHATPPQREHHPPPVPDTG